MVSEIIKKVHSAQSRRQLKKLAMEISYNLVRFCANALLGGIFENVLNMLAGCARSCRKHRHILYFYTPLPYISLSE